FGLQKVGHAGTLDPLASGVVLCLVNQGTKLSDYLLNDDKQYQVTMTLFQATTTYDAEGEVVESQTPFHLNQETINEVFTKYNGLTYQQTPPLYSAIKLRGKKLYEYARQNQPVTITPRPVTIKKLTLLGFTDQTITFEVCCSKGTYIRSLVVDLARELNTIAYVSTLRRTSS
ncbi:uncharacterized protein LOC111273348, partial [Varroa jacobsoni]|uniref:uncharacterized protein LOC111273348 n=1 Tax=Varroa jacobsoni TaxID=62625 RepID=UPI000BF52D03